MTAIRHTLCLWGYAGFFIQKDGRDLQRLELANPGYDSWDNAYGSKRAIVWLLKEKGR